MAKPTSPTKRPPARRHRRVAAGYTLVECMIATALLATSALGISGTVLSSYANDASSRAQYDAVTVATALMDELSSLPLDAETASDVSLMDFANYGDVVSADRLSSAVVAMAARKPAPPTVSGGTASQSSGGGLLGSLVGTVGGLLGGSSTDRVPANGGGSAGGSSVSDPSSGSIANEAITIPNAARRAVSIERRHALTGPLAADGAFALVTVDVTLAGGRTVRLTRLLTSTEAAANARQ